MSSSIQACCQCMHHRLTCPCCMRNAAPLCMRHCCLGTSVSSGVISHSTLPSATSEDSLPRQCQSTIVVPVDVCLHRPCFRNLQVVRAIGMDVTAEGVLLLSTRGPGFSTNSTIQLTVRFVGLSFWASGSCGSRQTPHGRQALKLKSLRPQRPHQRWLCRTVVCERVRTCAWQVVLCSVELREGISLQVTLPATTLRRVVNASPQGDVTLAPGFELGALNLVTGLGSGGFVAPSLAVGTLQLQSGG